MSNLPTEGNGNRKVTAVDFYQEAATQFWKMFSQWQRKAFENWTQWFAHPVMSAPAQLSQDILPGWVFGPQVNVYRTSDWGAEVRIRGSVAGYGSQLGTIEDCLGVFRKALHLPEKTLTEEDRKALRKFDDLVQKVNQAKGLPETQASSKSPGRQTVNAIASRRAKKQPKRRVNNP